MSASPSILEIAVETPGDVAAARGGGADRLELCAALTLGGLTPTIGQVREAREGCRLPIMAMIRPRSGDFVYEPRELSIMTTDIEMLRDEGVDGFVFGALTGAGKVDRDACELLLDRCDGLPATFHRAFDRIAEPHAALEQIIALGFARVLTSAGKPSVDAPGALSNLGELSRQAGDRIIILPGGGVRAENAAAVLVATGGVELHSSCRPAGQAATSEALVRQLRLAVSPR